MKEIININIEVNKENNDVVQELILHLTMVNSVRQEDAREIFILSESFNGVIIE